MIDKIIDNYTADRMWLSSTSIPWNEKIGYLLRKYRTIVTNKQRIQYLGHPFVFDNRFTPAILEMYPAEIEFLLYKTQHHIVRHVLDVGANVGQWPRTFMWYKPKVHLDSFEPNPAIFPLLQENKKVYNTWRVFPYGISDRLIKQDLYYTEYASASGGYGEMNRTVNAKKVPTKLVVLNESFIRTHALQIIYDVVKIDVEGMEKNVLLGLSHIQFNALYIEVDNGRGFGVDIEEINTLLQQQKRQMKFAGIFTAKDNSPEGMALFIKERY